MTEIIWLGRGGQGAFTAAKLLGAHMPTRKAKTMPLHFRPSDLKDAALR